ncbi:MAG: GFA family protein [Ferrovibrio sp.]
MAEATIHKGGCHCGAVRYEVSTALDTPVISCNCSICQKKGTLLSFVPADAFKLLSGKDAVQDYQFNTKNIHHLFCKTCGVTSFATGTAPNGTRMVAVNVRCLDDVDLKSLQVMEYDGKNA